MAVGSNAALGFLLACSFCALRPVQASAGYCPRSSGGSCEAYCQGFSNNLASMTCKLVSLNGKLEKASCVKTDQGAVVPCVHSSTGNSMVDGCFCCCTQVTGPIDTTALTGADCPPDDIPGSTCDAYCGRFSSSYVSKICQTISNGSKAEKVSCARNWQGTQIPCVHSSSSEGGPNSCHCCCTPPTQQV